MKPYMPAFNRAWARSFTALAGAIVAELPRDRMLQLSYRYDHPLFFDRFFGAVYPFDSPEDVATMRYEFAFEDLPEGWQEGMRASAEVLDWIARQFGGEGRRR